MSRETALPAENKSASHSSPAISSLVFRLLFSFSSRRRRGKNGGKSEAGVLTPCQYQTASFPPILSGPFSLHPLPHTLPSHTSFPNLLLLIATVLSPSTTSSSKPLQDQGGDCSPKYCILSSFDVLQMISTKMY